MKKQNHFFNMIAGLCVYSVVKLIFGYLDYKRMPDIYAMRSAPWYYDVLSGIFGFAIVVVIKGIIFTLEERKYK